MRVAETCSCGASFTVDGEDVMRLVREWRRKHICNETTSNSEVQTSGAAVIENQIGFRVEGLVATLPEKPFEWGDDE